MRATELIRELQRIKDEHGDVRVYVFDEYSIRMADDMEANAAFVAEPSKHETMREPHVQLFP